MNFEALDLSLPAGAAAFDKIKTVYARQAAKKSNFEGNGPSSSAAAGDGGDFIVNFEKQWNDEDEESSAEAAVDGSINHRLKEDTNEFGR